MPRLHAELATTVNSHLAAVPPAQIRAFDEEISAVPGLVKLTLGEPDFAVPDHVKKAAIESIQMMILTIHQARVRLNYAKRLVNILSRVVMFTMTLKPKL